MHLPECRTLSVEEVAEAFAGEDRERFLRLGQAAREALDFEGFGLGKCAPGCPVMADAVRRGRELAERHGW